jgi:hypothetical protein
MPYEIYEQRAAEQRRRIHNSVTDLRHSVKERLDVKRNAREYLWPAAGVAAVLGLALGWGITGLFTRD